MSNEELLSKIYQSLEQIKSAGCNFGKIELIVKGGEVKHVNVSYEMSLVAKKRYYHPTIPSENAEK